MKSVLNSRKFWFSLVLPIVIQTVALALGVITPTVYIAGLTTTTSTYAVTVMGEDIARTQAQAKVAAAEHEVTAARIDKATATIEAEAVNPKA